MLPFTKDELMGIVRWAIQQSGIADQDEFFVQAIADMMYDAMHALESEK